jgi:hypothetical protein
MTGYTPLPWGVGIIYRDSITGFWQCPITQNGVAFITVGGATKEQCEVNARLVAAAPILLETCKHAKKHLEPELVEPGRTVFWKLVAAIKQAGHP